MTDVSPLDDAAARVPLNARIAPDLRRRLRVAVRGRGSTVQDLVEELMTAVLDGIDVAGLRAGTAAAPGMSSNPRGAQTVPLNVRIRVPLNQRIEALVAAVPGVSKQGLVIEALETLGEAGESDDLWSMIAGGDTPTATPATAPTRKAPEKASKQASSKAKPSTKPKAVPVKPAPAAAHAQDSAQPPAKKKSPSKRAPTPSTPSPEIAPTVEAAKPQKRPLTAVGMLG